MRNKENTRSIKQEWEKKRITDQLNKKEKKRITDQLNKNEKISVKQIFTCFGNIDILAKNRII